MAALDALHPKKKSTFSLTSTPVQYGPYGSVPVRVTRHSFTGLQGFGLTTTMLLAYFMREESEKLTRGTTVADSGRANFWRR